MLRSPDPAVLLVLNWRAMPLLFAWGLLTGWGLPPRSALGVRLDMLLLGEGDRPRAACFSARRAQGLRAALVVSMSSAMLSCQRHSEHKCKVTLEKCARVT